MQSGFVLLVVDAVKSRKNGAGGISEKERSGDDARGFLAPPVNGQKGFNRLESPLDRFPEADEGSRLSPKRFTGARPWARGSRTDVSNTAEKGFRESGPGSRNGTAKRTLGSPP